MRLTRVVAIASLVLLSGTACQAGTTTDTSPIVIGADLELSGVDSAVGTVFAQALKLRVEELNTQGGPGGRPLELVLKDNHSDATTATADLTAFAGDPAVAAVIIGACSACAGAAGKTIESAKLPVVSLAPASAVVTPVSSHRYLFRLGPDADDSAATLTAQLHTAEVRRVALLATDDVDGSGAVAAFTGQLSRGTATLATTQTFPAGQTDLTEPVRAALAHAPDALVVAAFPAQALLVAKAARDAGYTRQIFFDATAAGDLFLSGPAGTAANGAIMAAPQSLVIDETIATSPARVAAKLWFTDYTARYGAFSGYSAYPVDALRLITDAIRTAGGTNHVKVRDAMESAAYDGLCGQVRFSAYDHSGVLPQALTTVVARAGRWRPMA